MVYSVISLLEVHKLQMPEQLLTLVELQYRVEDEDVITTRSVRTKTVLRLSNHILFVQCSRQSPGDHLSEQLLNTADQHNRLIIIHV